MSLSIQPPEPGNRNEEYMHGVKQPVLNEFQDVLRRKLDEGTRPVRAAFW